MGRGDRVGGTVLSCPLTLAFCRDGGREQSGWCSALLPPRPAARGEGWGEGPRESYGPPRGPCPDRLRIHGVSGACAAQRLVTPSPHPSPHFMGRGGTHTRRTAGIPLSPLRGARGNTDTAAGAFSPLPARRGEVRVRGRVSPTGPRVVPVQTGCGSTESPVPVRHSALLPPSPRKAGWGEGAGCCDRPRHKRRTSIRRNSTGSLWPAKPRNPCGRRRP